MLESGEHTAATGEILDRKGPIARFANRSVLNFERWASVLPPFIIEQIRKREERERAKRHEEQPRLELPIERPRPVKSLDDEDPNPDRGVIVVDLG